MTEIVNLSLGELLADLRAGDLSSREITQAYLDQIDRLNPALHAFLTLTPEAALSQADEADQRINTWRSDPGEDLPPLTGVPLAVKDVLCVKDIRCTCGSRILENFVPPFDATAVARLREAGVVILGKTNTDEFAMGSSNETSYYGAVKNPWNLKAVPGGSSGGSAAAVAARLAPAATGTDTGGSIRLLAAFCGLAGLKPTYGRVPKRGVMPLSWTLDSCGPLAWTVEDCAILLQSIAGHDPLDPSTSRRPRYRISARQ